MGALISWLLGLFGPIIDVVERVVGVLQKPTMEILPSTKLGWLDKGEAELGLLVWVNFRNELNRPFFVRSLNVCLEQHRLTAEHKLGVVSILGDTGRVPRSLKKEESILDSPQIPPMSVAKRFAFCPVRKEQLSQAGLFELVVEAVFPWNRKCQATLRLGKKF